MEFFVLRKLSKFLFSKSLLITQLLVRYPYKLNYNYRSIRYPDLVRFLTLQLIARKIIENKVPGNVAELGVYKGEFAREINSLFPENKMYLFDTFEGFNKEEYKYDIDLNLTTPIKNSDWPTSPQEVLKNMPYPDMCVIKQGKFPETAKDIDDEKFSFVSIDVDLYIPTLEGLLYFYTHLSSGGYIMIHDYNNSYWKGVIRAVDEFCRDQKISFVPIPDAQGSIVITK